MAFGEGWHRALRELCAGDAKKLEYAREVSSWFSSPTMLQNQALAVRVAATDEERERLPDLHHPLIENLIWAMGEARDSPDPFQRACWYMYQDRLNLRPVDHLAERIVPVLPLMRMMEMQPEQALPELERPPVQEEEACSSSKKNKAKK